MRRVRLETGSEWTAGDTVLASELEAVLREITSDRGLAAPPESGSLELRTDGPAKALALALRAAIGVLLAREHAHRPRIVGRRAELHALWDLLEPAVDGRRRPQTPFPSRRQADQLAYFRQSPEAVAQMIGLELDEADAAARRLGLRLSTDPHKLDRAPGQLDVVVDGDGYVTTIRGLHV